jgi:hypothetical protein
MRRRPSPFEPEHDRLYELLSRAADSIGKYHAYRAFGIERIPDEGPCLLVFNHSLATYDMFLLASEIFKNTGRVMRPLGDRLIFKTPGIKDFANAMGVVEGNMDNAVSLLREGHLVAVAPGGMLEAIRSSDERYKIRWDSRKGFCKVAMDTQSPVVLAACPAADDLYTVYSNPFTEAIYHKFKVPLPLLRGMGLSLLPRPVQLTHELSGPFIPPEWTQDRAEDEALLMRFHNSCIQEMEELMRMAASHHHLPYHDNWENRPAVRR